MATLMYRSASAVAENGATSLISRNAAPSRPVLSLPERALLDIAGKTARQVVPRSFSSWSRVWICRSICSRAIPHMIPNASPQTAASPSVNPTFGEIGLRGGVASVTIRASVDGKDCCWTVWVKRDRNVS